MQAAGLSFASATTLSNGAVSLADYQNLAKINGVFANTTVLSGVTGTASGDATALSLSASVAKNLIGVLNLSKVTISDPFLSGADAAALKSQISDGGLANTYDYRRNQHH
jgi:hypothetical protein